MIQGMLRIQARALCSLIHSTSRQMTTTQSTVSKAQLSKLRKMTGFPLINCKKALDQYENNIELAEKWLQEQAQKEGWAKATKLQSRPMSHGLVGVIGDSRSATMVEVNCETDFVARNEKFVALVSVLAVACQAHFKELSDKKTMLTSSALGGLSTCSGQKLSDLVALLIGNIGENMSLRRAVHVKASANTFLTTYIHTSGPALKTDNRCHLGRFASVMEVEQLKDESEPSNDNGEQVPMEKLCLQIAQHIVGMNPARVGDSNVDKPKNFKLKADTNGENPSEDTNVENPSEACDVNENNNNTSESSVVKVEEDLLIFQEFLLDSSVSVGDLMASNNITVKDFVRFECGEDLSDITK